MFNEVVKHVDDYLDSYSSLNEFKGWFYDLAFDIERGYSGEIVELVHHLEGILAESSSGHWSVAELDKELDAVVSPYRFSPRIKIVHVDDDGPRTFISSVPWELLAAGHSAI